MPKSDASQKKKTAPRTPATAPQQGKWHVRSEDGDTFGPASTVTLREWAADGRLAPSHEISIDGKKWIPIARLPDVQMDWIVEVSNGAFYGPIHRAHLDELIADESVPADATIFMRKSDDSGDPAGEDDTAALRKRMAGHEERFDRELTQQEEKLRTQEAELDKARAELKAKDLEFEAERQDFLSKASRHQAEFLKRDARVESLEKELSKQQHSTRHRHTMETKLADLEQQLNDTRTRLEDELKTARTEAKQHETKASQALKEREQQQTKLASLKQQAETEVEAARTARKQFALRRESVGKLLQQAVTALGNGQDTPEVTPVNEPIVIEASPVETVDTANPPPAGGLSLKNIEAQAQRELERLRSTGPGKGGAPWKKRGGAR